MICFVLVSLPHSRRVGIEDAVVRTTQICTNLPEAAPLGLALLMPHWHDVAWGTIGISILIVWSQAKLSR